MADRTSKIDPSSSQEPAGRADPSTAAVLRFLRLLGALRTWCYGHWLRSVIVAGAILSLIALTMAGWAYLADVALRSGELSLDAALHALDDGRHEEARAAVARMLKGGLLPRSSYGGPLYVLGAVKVHDAENQAAAERRRLDYLVASRYLKEARAYGMPPKRENSGIFLLGKSLVASGQPEDGVGVLDELVARQLRDDDPLARDAQRLLAHTCAFMPRPNWDKAIQHFDVLLNNPGLSDNERASALLHRAECLSRLERFEEARQAVAAVPPAISPAEIELMKGKLTLDELETGLQKVAANEREKAFSDRSARISEAMRQFEKAATLDAQKSHVTRQAHYQFGRGWELQGDTEAALKQYARGRQRYGESFEGLAAALAEADLLRQKGDINGAVLAYRRVLEAFVHIPVYSSVVLPLDRVRERLMAALKDFVDRKHFAEAIALLGHFPPLFTRIEQLELRGGTLEQWGNLLLSQAANDASQSGDDRAAGLQRLRAAGVAFEQLAELRFATKFYTADLWHSAETFYYGHNFTRTIRLLNEYLKNEPELRNAEALLRLGQSHLALGQIQQSIAAFEECIEFHPLDSFSFQARIDCAKAYSNQGNTSRAEQLLRDNIAGSSLKPSSREWKDSLFELGMLLHEKGQYEEAIGTLEEAVERYPQDSQRLVAQYLIGESYRRWAQELVARADAARTESEREKNVQNADDRLRTALNHFEGVQRAITLKTHDIHSDPLMGTMLRNCYMLEGTVLFDLGTMTGEAQRYKEAIEAYSNVASLYPDNPFVLETFVQIANCWRRLDRQDNARGVIQQARIVLERLPSKSDFDSTTTRSREEWQMLLADMSRW